ncbi:hypothetical protein [Clostridium minihomine]|uniref:hypothetical protein n=1 Tax=Clostridium minihomine TaxID=2045012 RepID=UPI000C78EC31|nr:hypothetical protein [Clostridium minihomine]
MADNNGPEIKTPRGEIIVTKAGKAQLVWSSSFKNKWPGQYSRAQQYVDREVLRLSTPLIPIRSSMLIKSGQLGTVPGSGLVRWIAPHARKQYYDTAESRPYDPQRGAFWFERMKAIYSTQIMNGAKKIAGGGEK